MKFLRDVLSLALVNFMVLSILGLFLIIHAGLVVLSIQRPF